jgi:excisionase family DNA binding protein
MSAANKPPAEERPLRVNDFGDVMTVEEVAEVMRCHPDTVRAWIRRGRLDYWRQGRLTRVTKAQLTRFLEGDRS